MHSVHARTHGGQTIALAFLEFGLKRVVSHTVGQGQITNLLEENQLHLSDESSLQLLIFIFNNVQVSTDTHDVDVSGTGITDDCETPNSSARMGNSSTQEMQFSLSATKSSLQSFLGNF